MTFAQLLVVQAHDSAIDRFTHARATLPEFKVLETIADEQTFLDGEHASLTEKRHEVTRQQKRLEDEAAVITERIDRENERLYSGTVTAHKDLQAIQEELTVLGKRRSDIEDHVLEFMEAGEPIDAEIEAVNGKLAALATRRTAAEESLAASQAALDDEIAAEQAQRAAAVADVDAAMVATYEQSRADNGGVGICRLLDKTCEGCHLQLPAVEIDRIRKEADDALIRCLECERILVR